ncbi:MAG: alcohol dehydrogenase catalytic domain-containing protein, partial [Mycobacteriales bacterium]
MRALVYHGAGKKDWQTVPDPEVADPTVTTLRPGDRVFASCISACGRCRYCREGAYGQCLGGGGWILGHRIDGVQAEYA